MKEHSTNFKSEDVVTDISYSKKIITEISTPIVKPSPKYIHIREKSVELSFRKFSDIINIIIPFFEKYPILGYKGLDFLDFKSVAEIIKTKEHLTEDGFNKIKLINSTMNQRRPWS